MANKPAKKPAPKAVKATTKQKPAKPVAKSVKSSKTKAAPPKPAAKKTAPKAKVSPKPAAKVTPASKKPVAAKGKIAPLRVKSSPKKSSSKPVKAAAKAPVKAKTPAPVAAKVKPEPAPVIKVEAKKPEVKPAKPAKGIKAPFMPLAVTGKPVPLPKVKKPVLDAAPEIVIKQAFNPNKMPPFYKKLQNRLLELRSVLYDAMEGMAKETLRARPEGSDGSVGGMHMGDAGSDAYDRDFALSMLSKEQDALYEISEALGRLDRGVYGVCELSGKKINDERLEALPYARYTREMQEQIERDQMGGRFRRPVVRSVFGLDDAADGDDDDEEGETPKEAAPAESSLDFMKE